MPNKVSGLIMAFSPEHGGVWTGNDWICSKHVNPSGHSPHNEYTKILLHNIYTITFLHLSLLKSVAFSEASLNFSKHQVQVHLIKQYHFRRSGQSTPWWISECFYLCTLNSLGKQYMFINCNLLVTSAQKVLIL